MAHLILLGPEVSLPGIYYLDQAWDTLLDVDACLLDSLVTLMACSPLIP